MKTTHTLKLALSALLAATASTTLAAGEYTAGEILEGINMFTPGEGDPSCKVKANEKYGTQWAVDAAYGYWSAHNQPDDVLNRSHYALLHAQLNQRLIEDGRNGGTWLRVEFSGSWGLDTKTASNDYNIFDTASTTEAHADAMFGPHAGIFPEIALMQYFAGKKACLIAGMVNLTNYFDAVSIANDSFSGFTNTGFVNSTILPLVDSNAGAVLQVEFNKRNYAMAAVSRTGATSGYNPFTNGGSGYCVVGEYGHLFLGGDLVLRLNPFYEQIDAEDSADGREHCNAGLVGSVEYTVNDRLTTFMRTGFGAKQYPGNSAEISFGATAKVIPSREDDFLGLAYGVYKGANCGDEPACNVRESVLEVMYSLQINDYMKLVPHLQYIHNAAYREGNGDEVLFGAQAVFSF